MFLNAFYEVTQTQVRILNWFTQFDIIRLLNSATPHFGMPDRCILRGCENFSATSKATGNVTFHVFPRDPEHREQWIRLLGVDRRQVTNKTTVCSLHFRPEDLKNRRNKGFVLLPKQIPLANESTLSDPSNIDASDQSSKKRKLSSEVSTSNVGTHGNPIILDSDSPQQSAPAMANPIARGKLQVTPELKAVKRNYLPFASESQPSSHGTSGSGKSAGNDPQDATFEYESSPTEGYLEETCVGGDESRPKKNYLEPDDTRNLIINERQLRLLLQHCPNCGNKCSYIGAKNHGVDTTFIIDCKQCQKPVEWCSHPNVETTPLHRGNLDITAAIIIAGNTFEDLKNIAENAKLKIMEEKTFYRYANAYVYPMVNVYFLQRQREILERKREEQDIDPTLSLSISMDCRFSRPGFTATFGVVSAMCQQTGEILSHVVRSKTDIDVTSSKDMETKGTRDVLNSLIGTTMADHDGSMDSDVIPLRIGELVTDENPAVGKMVNKEFGGIDHEHDPWHMAKAIMKRLIKKAKAKDNALLGLWIPSIRNFLWTIMKECDGCGDLMVEHWRSMLYHIIGIHEWPDDNSFTLVHGCSHRDLSGVDTAYLSPTSSSYAAFCAIVEDTTIHKRLKTCTLFLQTSLSESFHSLLGKYVPKKIKFTGPVFEARIKLGVLDWNENVNRPLATNQFGGQILRFTHPASAGAWKAKRARVERTRKFACDLMGNLPGDAVKRWHNDERVSTTKSLPTHLPLVSTFEPLDRVHATAQLYRD